MNIIKKLMRILDPDSDINSLAEKDQKKEKKKLSDEKKNVRLKDSDEDDNGNKTAEDERKNDDDGKENQKVLSQSKSVNDSDGGNGIGVKGKSGILWFSLGMFFLRIAYIIMYIVIKYMLNNDWLKNEIIIETCIGIKYMFDINVLILGIYCLCISVKRLKTDPELKELCTLTLWLFNFYFLKDYVWTVYKWIKPILQLKKYGKYGLIIIAGSLIIFGLRRFYNNAKSSEAVGLGRTKRLGVRIRTSILGIELAYLICYSFKMIVDYCVNHQILKNIFGTTEVKALDNLFLKWSGIVYLTVGLVMVYYTIRILAYFLKTSSDEYREEAGDISEQNKNNQE